MVMLNEDIFRMHDENWAKYMAEVVYCMWFHVFGATLPVYKNHSSELISFARELLRFVSKKYGPMQEIEIVYRRLFEACGNC